MKSTPKSHIWSVLAAGILMLLSFLTSFGQSNVDLQVKIETNSKVAMGGEAFSYTIVITNTGTKNATDVHAISDQGQSYRFLKFVSGFTPDGKCALEGDNDRYHQRLRCTVGDLGPNETKSIMVECRMDDFGDSSRPDEVYGIGGTVVGELPTGFGEINRRPMNYPGTPKAETKADYVIDARVDIGNVWVNSAELDDNSDNNRADVLAILAASKNIPPRITLLSPISGSVFTKPVNKQIAIPIIVNAFDVDGVVRKVLNGSTSWRGLVCHDYLDDDGKLKCIIEGRKYSREEAANLMQENWARLVEQDKAGTLRPPPEQLANQTSKDTYTFVAKELVYGENRVDICAFDDGGRLDCTTALFKLKSDSEIKITVTPKTIVSPNSSVIIETVSKLGPGVAGKVMLLGLGGRDNFSVEGSLMPQVSKVGNSITNRFLWRPTKEGRYGIRTILYENGWPTNTEDSIEVTVAEPRAIKITSLRNWQECTLTSRCTVEVYARDVKGNVINDVLEILVDGKSFAAINSSDCQICDPKSVPFLFPYTQKGVHTVQVVAKQEYGPELGRSEIYNIILK